MLDLVPTTFELAGVEDPNNSVKNGVSLVPLLEGKKTNGRKYAFTEIWGAQSAIDGRYHYIICGDQEFLYDWDNDPNEMKNLAGELPEVTATMRAAVKQWMKATAPVHEPKTF